jgi:hypothetical protein
MFKNLTPEYFPGLNYRGGNGCMFVDVNNDGYDDVYISTLGEKQFYLFVSVNGSSFIENSNAMGLANTKHGSGNGKTAGFSLDCADTNGDGYLDIITTEWLPLLDKDSEGLASDTQNIATNSRFFLNNNGEGFFDFTADANLQPSINAPRNAYMISMCEPIDRKALHRTMSALDEPFQKREKEHVTRHRLKAVIHNFLHAKYIFGHMNFTRNSGDIGQYRFFNLPYKLLNANQNDRFVTIECILLGSDRLGTMDIYADYQPTPTRKRYMTRTKPGTKVTLTVEINQRQQSPLAVGLKCNSDSTEGCHFELSFYTHKSNHHVTNEYPEDPCSNHDNRVKNVGNLFDVTLTTSWVRSETFLLHAVDQLKWLRSSKKDIRKQLRSLCRRAKQLDDRIDSQWSQTKQKIVEVIQNMRDGTEKWIGWQDYQSGELFNTDSIMHFQNFPLVGSFQFSAKFSDLDRDGFPDLIISGDFGQSAIYWNAGNGKSHFVKSHFDLISDVLDNSMGCTVGDWDMDGWPDVLFTSTSINQRELKNLNAVATTAGMILNFQGNHLYKNLEGSRKFEDVTDHAGVRQSGWGWGAFFFDFDNDGDLDALNGNGMDDPETTDDDFAVNQKLKLYVNLGVEENFAMKDEAEFYGIASTEENRGAMSLDYDKDGDLDILIVNHGAPLVLYKNEGGDFNDFLRVRVHEICGRVSIGAKVFLHLRIEDSIPVYREITNTAAFLGQSELVAHFGLGKVESPEAKAHNLTVQFSLLDGMRFALTFLDMVPLRSEIKVVRPFDWKLRHKQSPTELVTGETLSPCRGRRE